LTEHFLEIAPVDRHWILGVASSHAKLIINEVARLAECFSYQQNFMHVALVFSHFETPKKFQLIEISGPAKPDTASPPATKKIK
jgi:hypothetical protein